MKKVFFLIAAMIACCETKIALAQSDIEPMVTVSWYLDVDVYYSQFLTQVPKGIYIIRDNNGTRKFSKHY